MLTCPVCLLNFSKIDKQHLKKHSLTLEQYYLKYGMNASYGYSEELKRKKSGDNHPLTGKTRSDEQRKNISSALKLMWNSGKVSEKQKNSIGIRSKNI